MTTAGKRTCIRRRETIKNEGEKEEGNNRNVVVMVVVVIYSSTIRDAVLK